MPPHETRRAPRSPSLVALTMALAACGASRVRAEPAPAALVAQAPPAAPREGRFDLVFHSPHDPLAETGFAPRGGLWHARDPGEPAASWLEPDANDRRTMRFISNGALRVETPLAPDHTGAYRVTLRIDPVENDVGSLGWVSMNFTGDASSEGWVLGREMAPGFLLRSNANTQLFHRGVERPVRWTQGPPRPAPEYAVSLALQPWQSAAGSELRLSGSVNEAAFEAVLAAHESEPLPPRLYLLLGAHFHPGDVTRSRVRDVRINAPTPRATQ